MIEASDAAICKWENGISEPKVIYIVRLAAALGCSCDFLLGVTGETDEVLSPRADTEEIRLLKAYRHMSDERQSLLLHTAELWKNIKT